MDIGLIITSIISVIGPFITWILTKRKYYSEVENSNIKNMKESLEFWKQITEEQKEQLIEYRNSHKAEVEELKSENLELKKEWKEREAKFDSKFMQQQKDIAQIKNQMLSVYGQVCMQLNCEHRVHVKKEDIKI